MSDRYYLFGVPEGVDDEKMKIQLAKTIGYPDGIRDVNWCRPAVDGQGGVVRLAVDKKAAQLLKESRHHLLLDQQVVIFVDHDELPLRASCTIDDSIVTTVKNAMAEDKTHGSWDCLLLSLKVSLTRRHHPTEDYDYWLVEGRFCDLKRFDARLRQILFQGIPIQVSSTNRPVRHITELKAPLDDDEDSSDFAVKSGDEEEIIDEIPESQAKALGGQSVTAPFSRTPVLIEFVVGDLAKERSMDAIVNPTDYLLKANANGISRRISEAMGAHNYEFVTQSELDLQDSSCVDTFTVVTGAGCIDAKYIIHVAVPVMKKMPSQKASIEIGTCYLNILKAAKRQNIASVSFPPLGVESGIDANLAAGAAVSAFIETTSFDELSLSQFMKLIRFVFADHETMVHFMQAFSTHFEVSVGVQGVSSN